MDNLSSLGVALFETGMAWFWSDRRLKISLKYKVYPILQMLMRKTQVFY